jgi:hypothetical protein
MKRSGTLAVAIMILLGAHSAASQQPIEPPGGFFGVQRPDQILLSNLITAPVVGPDDRQIGNVDDLLMDDEGRVIGLVLDIGGFLGVGSRSVAIGIDHLEFGLVGEGVREGAGEPLPQWGPPSTPLVVPGATPEPMPRHAVSWRGITGGQIEFVRVPHDRDQLEAAPEFARGE